MRSKSFIFFSLILIFLIKAPLVQGDIINGDFSDGLNGWTTFGSVGLETDVSGNQFAVLSDASGQAENSLSRETQLAPGSYLFEFDYHVEKLGWAQGDANPGGPGRSSPDLFDVSLYFTSSSDPNIFSAVGAFQTDGDATPTTDSWTHVSLAFYNPYDAAMPYFSLFDQNPILHFYEIPDSTVYIDNVSITAVASVPESGTLLLLGTGLAVLIGFKRKWLFARCR